jgi:hypothetical protein
MNINTIGVIMGTTIAISNETKDLLKMLGSKGETYDEIIQKMSVAYEEFMEKQYKRLAETNKFRKLAF